MDPTVRLRIATRIHFALLRHYGEDVGVSNLLRGGDAAREALWVCEASGQPELVALAEQFNEVLRTEAAERAARAEAAAPNKVDAGPPQDVAWARDTSGFGITRPDELPEPAAADAQGSWFQPGPLAPARGVTLVRLSAARPACRLSPHGFANRSSSPPSLT